MPATTEINLPDEFASTMQQLVAEAAKSKIPPPRRRTEGEEDADGFAQLTERLAKIERALAQGFEKIEIPGPPDQTETLEQMQRLEEHLVALRSTESVNQRLFNSLHQELKNYRDNFLRESLQKPFIRDLVVLFDDLSNLGAQMDSAGSAAQGKGGTLALWQANLQNAIHSLMEILHRMEVTEIEEKDFVDRALHRVVSVEPADFAEDDGRIVLRIKRGFIWRDQVLRPEEVVARRFS